MVGILGLLWSLVTFPFKSKTRLEVKVLALRHQVNVLQRRAPKRLSVEYYNQGRTRLALGKDSPIARPVETEGYIVAHRVLGDIHHRYARL